MKRILRQNTTSGATQISMIKNKWIVVFYQIMV
jgi:hypothetical protein